MIVVLTNLITPVCEIVILLESGDFHWVSLGNGHVEQFKGCTNLEKEKGEGVWYAVQRINVEQDRRSWIL